MMRERARGVARGGTHVELPSSFGQSWERPVLPWLSCEAGQVQRSGAGGDWGTSKEDSGLEVGRVRTAGGGRRGRFP